MNAYKITTHLFYFRQRFHYANVLTHWAVESWRGSPINCTLTVRRYIHEFCREILSRWLRYVTLRYVTLHHRRERNKYAQSRTNNETDLLITNERFAKVGCYMTPCAGVVWRVSRETCAGGLNWDLSRCTGLIMYAWGLGMLLFDEIDDVIGFCCVTWPLLLCKVSGDVVVWCWSNEDSAAVTFITTV